MLGKLRLFLFGLDFFGRRQFWLAWLVLAGFNCQLQSGRHISWSHRQLIERANQQIARGSTVDFYSEISQKLRVPFFEQIIKANDPYASLITNAYRCLKTPKFNGTSLISQTGLTFAISEKGKNKNLSLMGVIDNFYDKYREICQNTGPDETERVIFEILFLELLLVIIDCAQIELSWAPTAGLSAFLSYRNGPGEIFEGFSKSDLRKPLFNAAEGNPLYKCGTISTILFRINDFITPYQVGNYLIMNSAQISEYITAIEGKWRLIPRPLPARQASTSPRRRSSSLSSDRRLLTSPQSPVASVSSSSSAKIEGSVRTRSTSPSRSTSSSRRGRSLSRSKTPLRISSPRGNSVTRARTPSPTIRPLSPRVSRAASSESPFGLVEADAPSSLTAASSSSSSLSQSKPSAKKGWLDALSEVFNGKSFSSESMAQRDGKAIYKVNTGGGNSFQISASPDFDISTILIDSSAIYFPRGSASVTLIGPDYGNAEIAINPPTKPGNFSYFNAMTGRNVVGPLVPRSSPRDKSPCYKMKYKDIYNRFDTIQEKRSEARIKAEQEARRRKALEDDKEYGRVHGGRMPGEYWVAP